MPKEVVPESDWPMYDWSRLDITVAGVVMALEGCSGDDDETMVAVITEDGRELAIHGVRVAGRRVEIIVSEQEVGG